MDSCDKFDNLRLLKSNFLINCRAQGGITVARLAQQKQLLSEVLIQFHNLPGDASQTRKVRPKRPFNKQKNKIDYTKLAAEIIRLQSGNINIPTSYNSTIIQADIHADAGTDHTRIIPTSPLSQNIDPAVNTIPTPIPSLAASEVRSRASILQ
ncbi:unnamed protein product [Mytilus coruscus]|uniref:Uncharacterized protein n=1 Tax=Mytilus coruscus TaxID=42192 RepID=A0A6J8EDJ0_MYTCO|nr:unnamed protein product [Mytilus coruscus]